LTQEKRRPQQPARRPAPATQKILPQQQPKDEKTFAIQRPLLWLVLAVLAVYAVSLGMGYTELDDTIFIRDFRLYNEDWSNMIHAFGRGLFNATKDPYYRPLFADIMQLNYKLTGDTPAAYHLVNMALHAVNVCLVYRLLQRLAVPQVTAFLLALIFAVHPVIAQAVTWIPGRNDTLLAVFVLSFLLQTLQYAEGRDIRHLLLATLFLLLAFFTKETAVFAAPAAFVLLLVVQQRSWRSPALIAMYVSWVGCFAIWFTARSLATAQLKQSGIGAIAADLVQRLPLIWQYIGKIFLPINLSVFPMQQDTAGWPGLIALALLIVALLMAKGVQWRMVWAGTAIFMLFLLPALLVPNNLNEQTFEHRLYLPMIGMLLLLPQTLLFKMADGKKLFAPVVGVCALLGLINIFHQQNFKDPHTFWSSAVATTPHSSYALMMLAARENDDLPKAYALFRKAYQINPNEKYLNFYYGKMMQLQDSVLQSEKYLLTEKKNSGYYECDFYLARVAMEKHDTVGTINYLRTYLATDSLAGPANNNLLLIYATTGRVEEAQAQARKMLRMGLQVPPQILQQLNMRAL